MIRNLTIDECCSSGGSPCSSREFRVQKVPQGVAQHVEPEDRQADGQAGEDGQPGGLEHADQPVSAEHPSPGRGRRGNPEPQEAEGGFGQDGVSQAYGSHDDDGSRHMGEDVPEDNDPLPTAEGPGGHDVFAFFYGQDRASDDLGTAAESADGQGHDERRMGKLDKLPQGIPAEEDVLQGRGVKNSEDSIYWDKASIIFMLALGTRVNWTPADMVPLD
jgi:hypothetical protein